MTAEEFAKSGERDQEHSYERNRSGSRGTGGAGFQWSLKNGHGHGSPVGAATVQGDGYGITCKTSSGYGDAEDCVPIRFYGYGFGYDQGIKSIKFEGATTMKNQKYIIRGDKSGVFYGEIKERNPNDASNVVFSNIRRIWYWDGAATCSQLALDGVAAPNNCKFTVTVAEIELTDVVELIPCTDEACASIDAVPVWKR